MRGKLESQGTKLAFVFMESETLAEPFFARYGVADALRFSDPNQVLYGAFELGHVRFFEMARPSTLWRFIKSIWAGYGVSFSETDMSQMSGSFLFHNGKIVKSFRNKAVSDKPDYCELAT